MAADRPLFSIIITTYNRARLLRTAIESVLQQDFDPGCFEILVIDNNSTDGTGAMVQAMLEDDDRLSYRNEVRQGLPFSRNLGWQQSKGTWCVFLDDDAKAPPDWLTRAAGIVDAHAPDAFGGPYTSYYDSAKPVWWRDHYRNIRPIDEARLLDAGEYLSGGNLFIRRDLLAALDGFALQFGHAGRRLSYGDETDLLNRLRQTRHGAAIYYDHELFVYHLVHAEKMTLHWAARFNFASGRSFRAFHREVPEKTALRVLQLLLALGREVGILALRFAQTPFRDRARYPYWQNFVYELVLRRLVSMGSYFEQLVT